MFKFLRKLKQRLIFCSEKCRIKRNIKQHKFFSERLRDSLIDFVKDNLTIEDLLIIKKVKENKIKASKMEVENGNSKL